MVSKISPHIADKIEVTAIKPLTINVGKRGTKPVLKYSISIGKNNISAININRIDIAPKNLSGR